jgi:type 1 glutamine amidotransferase
VLFPIDPESGEINPDHKTNIPGLEALATADLMIIATRMRTLPDEQMRHVVEYVKSGRPIIGMRTATHAFELPGESAYADWDWRNKDTDGGFGRLVLGETWISHHGHHKQESTRGIIAPGMEGHAIIRGCEDIWGPTDVYGVRLPLPGDSQPLVLGQVLTGMQPTDQPVDGEKNDPLMPIAWVKSYQLPDGKPGRAFVTTMGAATDLQSEGLRRLLVNAAYWLVGLEEQIPERANVDLVGEYAPTEYGFGGYTKGVKPSEHAL